MVDTERSHGDTKDIQKATETDEDMQEILQTLRTWNWEKIRKGYLSSYYSVREELYEAEGILMRDHRIIVPRKLQRKIGDHWP